MSLNEIITKEYRIRLIADKKEHNKFKREIEFLYDKFLIILEGNMELYIQSIETKKNWGNRLYGLGSIKGKNLQIVK